jgi:hypothetical protein
MDMTITLIPSLHLNACMEASRFTTYMENYRVSFKMKEIIENHLMK